MPAAVISTMPGFISPCFLTVFAARAWEAVPVTTIPGRRLRSHASVCLPREFYGRGEMAAKRPSTGVALVENDAAAFDSLRLLLDGRGLGVVGFGSAEDLLSRLPAWQPACVVS